ncbi:MAG: hypothetical protein OQJ84_01585 [Xanthomonadales bacterium]|nr:hypothetical protein [Xanthomonadales bacterium]
MRDYINKAALAVLFSLFAAQASAQAQPQLINIPLSRPGEPIELDISIISARIEVIGEDREDAVFEVTVEEGARKIITPSGTKSLKTAAFSLEVEERDNHISVDTDWRAKKVNVVARVPRLANLNLSTVNNGEIIVSNITGKLVLENVNGPITASNISGSVIAEAVNRDISVSFASLDTSQAMSFTSVNGDLKLGLPSDAGVELHIDSSEGEIYSDYEVEIQPTEPEVIREDGPGGVEVKVKNMIVANINGGGPVIRLKTLNGNIEITKSGN